MNVVDLAPEHEKLYVVCLEDWSAEMKDAGDHKERWYRRAGELGERVLFQEHLTAEPQMFREWGISDALFIRSVYPSAQHLSTWLTDTPPLPVFLPAHRPNGRARDHRSL